MAADKGSVLVSSLGGVEGCREASTWQQRQRIPRERPDDLGLAQQSVTRVLKKASRAWMRNMATQASTVPQCAAPGEGSGETPQYERG
ncbi:hypothetical protein Ct61P_08835 [Colletotrichum tofieldiae]|nr:hypothetical protein Ct61P_08835 [Colletotrichum tofieldiae]